MRIYKIKLQNLRNEEHFLFMTEIKNLIESTGKHTLYRSEKC